MILIPWEQILSHLVWIVGLAMAVAIVGFLDWHAAARGSRSPYVLLQLPKHPGFLLALALVWLGFGLAVPQTWDKAVGFLFAASLAALGLLLWLRSRIRG